MRGRFLAHSVPVWDDGESNCRRREGTMDSGTGSGVLAMTTNTPPSPPARAG